MNGDFIFFQIIKVNHFFLYNNNLLTFSTGFYDPDGYKFDENGLDEFGGYYDDNGNYYPGEKNKHEFYGYQ